MKMILNSMLVVIALALSASAAERGPRVFSARLSGYNEVHFDASGPALRGAVSTPATGSFLATLNSAGDIIDYELTYQALTGTVTQAHIHFGQPSTVGGIVVWLCQTATNQAPGTLANSTPTCPQEGTVKGTIMANQVLAQGAQGFAAGDFDALIQALRAETAYANVHSSPTFGQGEIRGQINIGRRGK